MMQREKIDTTQELTKMYLEQLTNALRQSKDMAEFIRNSRKLTTCIRLNQPTSRIAITFVQQATSLALERHHSLPKVTETSATRRALGRVIAKNNDTIHALRLGRPMPVGQGHYRKSY